ncbi:O13D1 protein, partial [Crocuta crocuta]
MKMGNYSAVTEFFLVGLSKYPEIQLVLFMLCLIMYVIILLGNSLLIVISILDSRLHTPMYFFLGNLSFLDICYTSSSIPPMLIIFKSGRKSISIIGCALQMVISLGLGSTECVLLAVMAYDRYVAICNPLRYPIIMNKVLYVHMAAWSWTIGCLNSLVQTVMTMILPFCGNNMGNYSAVTEFFLVGLSKYPELQLILFVLCLIMYVIILLGNSLLIVISILDSRLHTPMYFFLGNLSFLDICYTSSSIPPMLIIFKSGRKSISFTGCALQMVISLGLGSTECVLLAVMAYDRYVAICNPLRYPIIMNKVLYVHMAAWSWTIGCLNSLVQTVMTMILPFCGNNVIDHITCEILALLKLVCSDISMNVSIMTVTSIVLLIIPLLLIFISYVFILSSILRINSAEGRKKAFSTCSAHLT